MRKLVTVVVAVALTVAAGSVAYANFCARDVVPSAALLVPYAAVSANLDPNGQTTIFTITNVSKDAQIVHITIWNMFSEHVVDFDVILTGYDVIWMNFRDILQGKFNLLGTRPVSATTSDNFIAKLQLPSFGYVPYELGPDGRGSQTGQTLPAPQDRNVFASSQACQKFPYDDYSVLAPDIFQCFRDKILNPLKLHSTDERHTSPNAVNTWLRRANVRLDMLQFYVTAEVVRDCNTLFPAENLYWSPQQYPTYSNVLIGDVIWLNSGANFSEAMPAVHIERDAQYLGWGYYDRYTSQVPFASGYEPLATAFAVRYANLTDVKSWLLFWKSRIDFVGMTAATGRCDGFTWINLGSINEDDGYAYYSWDMDELPGSEIPQGCVISPCPAPPGPFNVLPFETQRVPITSANFNLPGAMGWMLFVLPASYPTSGAYGVQTRPDSNGRMDNLRSAQGWAAYQFVYTPPSGANYSAAIEAATMANQHCFSDQVLPWLGINYDYVR